MKVVVAGGSGLIGRALAMGLAGKGHEVVILSRSARHHHSWRVRSSVASADPGCLGR